MRNKLIERIMEWALLQGTRIWIHFNSLTWQKNFQIWLFLKCISIRVCQDQTEFRKIHGSLIENQCEERLKFPICHSWQACSTTKCNTNCYIYMYKNISNGDLYTERGCNDGNQLTNNLEDSSIYNLGSLLKYLKKFRS